MRTAKFILQLGTAATFFGHGYLALTVNPQWLHLITAQGISLAMARNLMPIIGLMDIAVAVFVLFYPIRIILLWAFFWAMLTALARPLSGMPVWEFIERGANWAAPLALFFWKRFPKNLKSLMQP